MQFLTLISGIFVVLINPNGIAAMELNIEKFKEILPARINGWTMAESDRFYSAGNLYEYINGGAELYRSYGFKRLFNRIYAKQDQPDIIIDIFDMQNAANAYGVFMHSRETLDCSIGQGSEISEGMVTFWKDRWYVTILAFPATDSSRQTMMKIARRIESSIPEQGPLPELLKYLPEENLIEASIRYFYHYIWLNSHLFIADRNILNIDENTRALLARYHADGGNPVLLIIAYPDETESAAAKKQFARHYAPELEEQTLVQIEDGSWVGCMRINEKLLIVLDAPQRDSAEKLVHSAEKKISAK